MGNLAFSVSPANASSDWWLPMATRGWKWMLSVLGTDNPLTTSVGTGSWNGKKKQQQREDIYLPIQSRTVQ